jgi:hypothetical protein
MNGTFIQSVLSDPSPEYLRDQFAMAALQGLISGPNVEKGDCKTFDEIAQSVAKASYRFADAMMKQREAE